LVTELMGLLSQKRRADDRGFIGERGSREQGPLTLSFGPGSLDPLTLQRVLEVAGEAGLDLLGCDPHELAIRVAAVQAADGGSREEGAAGLSVDRHPIEPQASDDVAIVESAFSTGVLASVLRELTEGIAPGLDACTGRGGCES
jgi:hypothetical protein